MSLAFSFFLPVPEFVRPFCSRAVPHQHKPGPLRAGRKVRVGHGRTLRGRPYQKPAGRACVLAGPLCHPLRVKVTEDSLRGAWSVLQLLPVEVRERGGRSQKIRRSGDERGPAGIDFGMYGRC